MPGDLGGCPGGLSDTIGSSVKVLGDCMGSFWKPMWDLGIPGESLRGALAPPWGLLGACGWVSGLLGAGFWDSWRLLGAALACFEIVENPMVFIVFLTLSI